jgi:FkbM family methyltransferase
MGLRRSLRKLLGYKEPDQYLNISYSQEGEDMVLYRTFEALDKGYYIDVGAHHPIRFSNTYKFYKMGWRGINIDAMPGSMVPFTSARPLDINLEIPVSGKPETLPFYIFNETALNTFSKELADERSAKPEYEVVKVVEVKTETLENILDTYLPQGQKINFLSIDAEGFDFEILKSNNWTKYRPDVLLIESDFDYNSFLGSEVNIYMQSNGYELYAKTLRTYFFKSKSISF